MSNLYRYANQDVTPITGSGALAGTTNDALFSRHYAVTTGQDRQLMSIDLSGHFTDGVAILFSMTGELLDWFGPGGTHWVELERHRTYYVAITGDSVSSDAPFLLDNDTASVETGTYSIGVTLYALTSVYANESFTGANVTVIGTAVEQAAWSLGSWQWVDAGPNLALSRTSQGLFFNKTAASSGQAYIASAISSGSLPTEGLSIRLRATSRKSVLDLQNAAQNNGLSIYGEGIGGSITTWDFSVGGNFPAVTRTLPTRTPTVAQPLELVLSWLPNGRVLYFADGVLLDEDTVAYTPGASFAGGNIISGAPFSMNVAGTFADTIIRNISVASPLIAPYDLGGPFWTDFQRTYEVI